MENKKFAAKNINRNIDFILANKVMLSEPIDHDELSLRAFNLLSLAGVKTNLDLMFMDFERIDKNYKFGIKTIYEVLQYAWLLNIVEITYFDPSLLEKLGDEIGKDIESGKYYKKIKTTSN